jgi:pimeloyl-ACP methyl ester carboxylesterase
MPKPTFVLVHGACHGPDCWAALAPLLRAAGFAVVAVDLPSSGPDRARLGDLHADSAVVRAAVDACESAIVIAHSYGGAPVTEGLAGAANVARLVYLAAFMPAAGESLTDLTTDGTDDWALSADGLTIAAVDPGALFYGQCPPATAAAAIARLVPQAAVAFGQPVDQAAWTTIPSTYVVCDDDHAIRPAVQRRMAAQADTVTELASDHSPFLSHPQATAALLVELAASPAPAR